MDTKTKTYIGLFGSLLLILVGLFRLVFEDLNTTTTVVSVIFFVSGMIGAIGNTYKLRKADS